MKNFNKKYLIFIGLGVVFLITAFIFKDSIKGEENIPKQNINTSLNIDKGQTTKSSQLEAYYQEEQDSIKNARKGFGMDLSNFGKSNRNNENINTSTIKKSRTDDEIIDSILNAQKITYKKPVVKKRRSNKKRSNYKNDRKGEIEREIRERLEKENQIRIAEEKRIAELKRIAEENKPLTKIEKIQKALNSNNNKILDKINIKTVKATIDNDQKILNGGSVNMRLLEDLKIGKVIIPEDSSIYGVCKFSNHGRVLIEVHSISYKNKRIPVELIAYDYKDGQKGLLIGDNLIKNAISDEAKNETSSIISDNGGKIGGIINAVFKKNKKVTKVQLYDEHWIYLKPKK